MTIGNRKRRRRNNRKKKSGGKKTRNNYYSINRFPATKTATAAAVNILRVLRSSPSRREKTIEYVRNTSSRHVPPPKTGFCAVPGNYCNLRQTLITIGLFFFFSVRSVVFSFSPRSFLVRTRYARAPTSVSVPLCTFAALPPISAARKETSDTTPG